MSWAAIRAVREAVTIPVVANGDIVDAGTARQALQASGADAVMVGRGAQGRPWLLAEIAAALGGGNTPAAPVLSDRTDMISRHYEAMLSFYGVDLGHRVARKHLGWYMDDAGTAQAVRREVLTASDPGEVLKRLPLAMGERVAA